MKAVDTGLDLLDIRHRYGGVEVLHGVSAHVAAGQVGSLLGPSGCGKTTLLRLTAGLERLQHGEVRLGGRLVADASTKLQTPPEKRRVGMVFQDYALFPHLTIEENIMFGVHDHHRRSASWMEQALRQVGLNDLTGRYPHTLSGGQQQRVALLRALAPAPDILLLDEPFSGLDATLRAQVREETLSLLRQSGVATLLVTHDPEEAMVLSDRIFVMHAGRIVQASSPAEIYHRPANSFVANLFGTVNQIAGQVENGRVVTCLGAFPAKQLAEGSTATVLIRAEGLHLSAPSDEDAPVTARVTLSLLRGQASEIQLRLEDHEQALRAWVPGVLLPNEGERLAVEVDPAQVFVFGEGG